MKYIKSFFAPIIILLLMFSCNDGIVETRTPPTPTNESVSGTAFYDTDGDGLGDEAMHMACVYLGDSIVLSDPEWKDTIVNTALAIKAIVDSNGNYIFEGVQPKENQLLRIYPVHTVTNLIGVDNAPDGDINETLDNEFIQITIDENENDNGNDFVGFKMPIVVIPPSISGYVLIDEDMDLIGDGPAENHRMELYDRNADGVPTSQTGLPIAAVYTDVNGYYEFTEIPNGEYVIYHIGTGDYPYSCVSNMDETPETGEPTFNAGCQFIPVNLTDSVTEDHDNIYVIDLTVTIEPGKLSGVIHEDITSDGQPDEITDLIITVDLYERDLDGFKTGLVLYSTVSMADGTFSLDNIEPGSYVVGLNESSNDFNTIYGSSSNGGPQPLPDYFPLDITSGDEINDSYFWIYTMDNIPSISGGVAEDVDGDGVGDNPQFDHTVELYLRGADDLPTGNLLYKTNTTSGGMFYFTNISTGDYVLVLTGPSNFSCSSSVDYTPEAGEPTTSPSCEYIPVNFVEGVEDKENFYIVQQ